MFADNSIATSAAADSDLVPSQSGEETYLASAAAERTEARARSALKAALVGLAPLLEAEVARAKQKGHSKAGTGVAPAARPATESGGGEGLLREHIELRGFLPVAAHIEVRAC